MFEEFENNPDDVMAQEPSNKEDVEFLKTTLVGLAPDFVAFVEKFGSANIGEGFFDVYGWILDLDEHLSSMGHEKLGLNGWVFGDGDGDMGVIDKETGEFFQVCHESADILSPRFKTFSEFLRNWLLRE